MICAHNVQHYIQFTRVLFFSHQRKVKKLKQFLLDREIISSTLTAFRGQVAKLWIRKRWRPRIRKLVTSPTLLREPQISHDTFDSLTAKLVDKNPNWFKRDNCPKHRSSSMVSNDLTGYVFHCGYLLVRCIEYEVEHSQSKLDENNEYKNVTLSKA
jgi:hypothetical protein